MAEQTQVDSVNSVEDRLASYFATTEPEAPAEAAAEGPATDDAVEDDEQPAEDSLEEIDWEDGQKYRVPKPLKEGFMRQQDYTRKTQELAELRKHAQVAAEAANAMQQFQAATADEQRELTRVQADIERYKGLDWSSLDTDTYIKAKHQLDTLKERAGEIQQGLGAKAQQFANWRQQQTQQVLQSGENYLRQAIPNWGMDAKQEVRAQALASGYTDAELEQVLDPRFVRLAWKAAQFDKLQAGKSAAVQQASKAPPVVKPGATNNQAARESKYKDARTRLKKSGDLRDIVYDISPMDTIFLTRAGRGTAKSTTHEWLVDSLGAPAKNAKIEGDTFSANARTLPSRLKNYTQIARKEFEVTGTSQRVDNAGMRELMAYHTARAAKEIKRDMEKDLLSDEPASAGASTAARVSAGAEAWIYAPNHISVNQTAATTTAPVSGFATSPVTDGSATAFTEAGLKDMLKKAWSAGGEVDTILTTASLYSAISGFTGLATRFRDVSSRSQAQIIGAADVYVSPYGSHNIVLSRYCRAGTVFALDMTTWEVAYLRPFQTIDIAKVGDSERRMLLAEYTLVAKSPRANTKATNMT